MRSLPLEREESRSIPRGNHPPVPSLHARQLPGGQARTHFQYLLDLDPELGAGLDVRMRLVARRAVTAAIIGQDAGELELSRWLTASRQEPGLLILGGTIVAYARVCDRVSAELLGRGDLIQPCEEQDEDEFMTSERSWHVLTPAQVAILDDAFAERVRPWPQVEDILLRRVQRRARDQAAARAINAQPRLDLRLVLMLWHLAPRWGKVEPSGIRLPLPLTHQLLGRLVGAERPSVTHALKRLAAAGLVGVQDDGLHLRGRLEEHLSVLGDVHVEQLARPDTRRGVA